MQAEMTTLAEVLFGHVPEGELRTFRRMLHEIGARLSDLAVGETAPGEVGT